MVSILCGTGVQLKCSYIAISSHSCSHFFPGGGEDLFQNLEKREVILDVSRRSPGGSLVSRVFPVNIDSIKFMRTYETQSILSESLATRASLCS